MAALLARFLVLAVFQCLQVAGLRRELENLDKFEKIQNSSECVENLKAQFFRFTYSRYYRPIMPGTYRIRNRHSGKYLTATPDGTLGTTRHLVDSSKMSDWQVEQMQAIGQATHSLKNRKSGKYLSFAYGPDGVSGHLLMADEKLQWELQLNEDGVYYHLDCHATGNVIYENQTGVLEIGPDIGSKADWEVEMILGWLRWPRSAEAEYQRQWETAANIPIWRGGTYTYKQSCEDEGRVDECKLYYAQSRARHLLEGRISETSRRIVTETLVRRCDSSVYTHRLIWLQPLLLEEMRAATPACEDFNFQQTSWLMKQAIEETCYTNCVEAIRVKVNELSMDCSDTSEENWKNFFEAVAEDHQCDLLPDVLVAVVEFAMSERCWRWAPRSVLWVPNDQGPGTYNLKRADGQAVCSMPAGKESFRDDGFIIQSGMCEEGTTCECPKTWVQRAETLSARRFESEAPSFFTPDRAPGIASVAQTALRAGTTTAFFSILIGGMTPAAALMAAPYSGSVMYQTTMAFYQFVKGGFEWSCGKVVGCWPKDPERRQTQEQSRACRLPELARGGGSPFWFMPPPAFMFKHRTFAFRKCTLEACTKADIIAQRVEFGENKQNVYNCQPLNYMDMTSQEKELYKEELRKTIPSEYAAVAQPGGPGGTLPPLRA